MYDIILRGGYIVGDIGRGKSAVWLYVRLNASVKRTNGHIQRCHIVCVHVNLFSRIFTRKREHLKRI